MNRFIYTIAILGKWRCNRSCGAFRRCFDNLRRLPSYEAVTVCNAAHAALSYHRKRAEVLPLLFFVIFLAVCHAFRQQKASRCQP